MEREYAACRGPILPACEPQVLIGGQPAARVGGLAQCSAPSDVIAQGSPTVLIGGRMAARKGDRTMHGGVLQAGDPTVLIGDGGVQISQKAAIAHLNLVNQGRAAKSAKAFTGQQKNKDTCGLMAVQSILLERDGTAPKEGWSSDPAELNMHLPRPGELWASAKGTKDLIDIGAASGAYTPCNGTTDMAKIMKELARIMHAPYCDRNATWKPLLLAGRTWLRTAMGRGR